MQVRDEDGNEALWYVVRENSNRLNAVTIFSDGELVLHEGNNCNNVVGCSKDKVLDSKGKVGVSSNKVLKA